MNVIEIFSSIEGEGTRQGYLCTFVRLYGCNLRCSYCDTPYSYEGGEYTVIDVKEVAETVRAIGNKYVTITGGEPLLQEPQVIELIKLLGEDYEFNIETNGSVIPTYRAENVFYTVDYKCPTSNEETKMKEEAFLNLHKNDVVKFVVGSIKDLQRTYEFIKTHDIQAHIYLSPSYQEITAREIVEFMKDNNMQDVRVQLQIHKYIWDVNERGV